MCVRTCSAGLVLDREKEQCIPCHPSCATCFGPTRRDCLSCRDRRASLEGSVCKDSCGNGKYRDPETSYCESCHPSCKTCTGGGRLACSACIEGLFYSSALKQCLSKCKEGQYRSNEVCYMCSSSCKACKGPSGSDCLSCAQNRWLYNSTCVKSCPADTYQEESNGLMECRKCHPSCVTCTGDAANQCTSCRQDLYLEKSSCVKQCSGKFRLDEETKICKTCNDGCPGFANLTDRSIYLPKNMEPDQSRPKRHSHFILVGSATAATLLAIFAVLGILKARSSRGYTKVKVENTSPNVEEPLGYGNNNMARVFIHGDDLEGEAMLDHQDSTL